MRRARRLPGGQPVPARVGHGLAVGLLAAAVTLAGCGGSSGSKKTAGATVTIKNFAFSPQPLKTTSGTTITVRNVDTSTHTFTADDKSFDAGEIPAGSVKTVRVSGKGTVGYHCQIHDYMKGALAFG